MNNECIKLLDTDVVILFCIKLLDTNTSLKLFFIFYLDSL